MTSLDDWRAGGAYFLHRGFCVFWREDGDRDAPALLAIHGFPCSSADWRRICPTLAARYRVLTIDMIGFGFSDKPFRYRYGVADQADLCDEFLALRLTTEYHIIAQGAGVGVAQELVVRSLESQKRPRLLSVCFLNGGMLPHRLSMFRGLRWAPEPVLSLMTTKRSLSRVIVTLFGPRAPPDRTTLEEAWTLATQTNGRQIIHKLVRFACECAEPLERRLHALKRVQTPVKLIEGVLDPLLDGQMGTIYRDWTGRLSVTTLPEIGRYPQIQAPREVAEALFEFHNAF